MKRYYPSKPSQGEKKRALAKAGVGLMGLFFLIVSLPTLALQTRWVKDNSTATATLSVEGMTRIAVDNDRIVDVRGPHGLYTLENDKVQGAVYLKLLKPVPSLGNAQTLSVPVPMAIQPFSVFIATEQNHNYVLRLIPRHQEGEAIVLKPVGGANPVAAQWESSSPYTEAMTDLMAGMVKGQAPEGYSVENSVTSRPQYLGTMAVAHLIRLYSGAHLQGQVYTLTNRTFSPLHLTENEFYQSGDRAIALSALNVAPQGKVFLYKVVSHDE